MVSGARPDLLPAVIAWLKRESSVESAVLFGSTASRGKKTRADGWSDFDLHVVTRSPRKLERIDWARSLRGHGFVLQIVRSATGGVRKVTALFASGQLDLVLVPAAVMKNSRAAAARGQHRRPGKWQVALNEMATCLAGGYRFLKGEKKWGDFYSWVAVEMIGVRVSDSAAAGLAALFLSELLWVFQKIHRGELMAAQLVMHRSLAETNFRLVRELRLRRGDALDSFGLGRHAEATLAGAELDAVRLNARLNRRELTKAAWHSLAGLRHLMCELVPAWSVSAEMQALLNRHAPTRAS